MSITPALPVSPRWLQVTIAYFAALLAGMGVALEQGAVPDMLADLGDTYQGVALLTLTRGILFVIGLLGGGWLANRFGLVLLGRVAAGLLVVALLIGLLATGLGMLLVAMAGIGLSAGWLLAYGLGFFSRTTRPARRTFALAMLLIANGAGTFLAPFLAADLAMLFTWRWIFVVQGAAALILLVLLWLCRIDTGPDIGGVFD